LDSLDNKNPCSKNGNTPLYFAAKNSHFEICKLFLHYDIEINQRETNMLKKNGQMELIDCFNEASASRRR
jgi:ankyrin repeat protein